ncbi:MAG: bifunctional diguanylate cyclase/phosphodiesterase [Acidimicrobiia bacterium]|nr:bifunctional diguanylate cyclase/phosphodiesterase [Acidimicrobiia bacterium]
MSDRARPRLPAVLLTATVFGVGVTLTLVGFAYVEREDDVGRREVFAQQADNALDGMEDVVDVTVDDVNDVVTFAGSLDPPDPVQFQRFVGATNQGVDGELILYIERVEPGDLESVVERETRDRDAPFVPLSDRFGETMYLVMRSATPGASVDVPPGDVGLVPSFREVLEYTTETRQLGLVDFGDIYAAIDGPDGLAAEFGVAPSAVVELLEQIGIGEQDAADGVEYGIVAPVDDQRGRIVGYVLGDSISSVAFERFASRTLDVSVVVSDRNGGTAVVAGPADPPADDGVVPVETRTVALGGLDFELAVYARASAVADGNELFVPIGLALTLLAAMLAHVWRRRDLQADELTEQLVTTERRANTDPLTGLLNREGITDALTDLLARRHEGSGLVAALFVDVDRLKVVNDSLGHGVGDEVLVRLAQRFQQVAVERAAVGRFGGDEFVLVAGGLRDLGAAIGIAQDVLRSLTQPLRAGDVELRVDASVGVAFARSTEAVEAADLIRDADAAMYEAKRGGGSRYSVFDDRLRVEAVDRLLVEQSLGQAVQLREMETWFQPIVDVDRSALAGLEALVRWRSDDDGVVTPHRFLPVALETGLIVPIGGSVLVDACEVAAELAGQGLSVAVNLSERELADPSCVDRVLAAVERSGIETSQLVLEVSEDLMLDRLARSVELLRTIRERGVRLAIDDFGTGMSSLSYVKRLDMISELKIDQSFVADIGSSEADRAIVAAIMAMSESLGMQVVAEGVETDLQVARLRDLGVRLMQGYHFGRPVPRAMAVELARAGNVEPSSEA